MNTRNISLILIGLSTLTHSFAFGQAGAQPQTTLRVEGEVSHPITIQATDLAKMKRVQALATDHDGKEHNFSGFSIASILELAGAPLGSQLRGKNMNKYLLVISRDGYRTVFSLAELDSSFTSHTILLADQTDGHPLPADKGPFQIIVPGEKK